MTASFRPSSVLAGLALALAFPALSLAGVPAEPAQKAAVAGEPAALVIQPPAITLAGPRSRQQVVVTARYGDNSVRDLTSVCEVTCEDAGLLAVEPGGFLAPKKNGTSKVVVKVGKQSASVP